MNKAFKVLAITLVIALSGLFPISSVNASRTQEWYVVQEGDTYYSLSNKFDIDLYSFDIDEMLTANESIAIPEYTLKDYYVKKGDTLYSLAKNNNISIELIQMANPDMDNFKVNTKLAIPCKGIELVKKQAEKQEEMRKINAKLEMIKQCIKDQKEKYPGMEIGVGIYQISKEKYILTDNIYKQISCGCTVKAAYAMYVLQQCEKQEIDIYTTYLTYKSYMRNGGSGIIKTMSTNKNFSIDYLIDKLLTISDNTAYNILLSQFTLDGYQEFLDDIGGQQLNKCRYGACSVNERTNEWINIYKYCKTGKTYSEVLEKYLSQAKYSYLAEGFTEPHYYMHKSGWCDGTSYNSASDAILVDNEYLIIVLTHDYKQCIAHTDVVKEIGKVCDENLF